MTSQPETPPHTRLGSERRCFACQSRNARTSSGRPDIPVPFAGMQPCFDSAAIYRSGPRRPPRQSWISLAVVSGGRNSALIFEAAPPPPLLRRAPNSSSPPHCSLLLYLAPGGLPASASTLRGSEAPRSPICNPNQSGPRVPSASDNLAMRSTEVVLEGRIAPQMRCGSCSWRGGCTSHSQTVWQRDSIAEEIRTYNSSRTTL